MQRSDWFNKHLGITDKPPTAEEILNQIIQTFDDLRWDKTEKLHNAEKLVDLMLHIYEQCQVAHQSGQYCDNANQFFKAWAMCIGRVLKIPDDMIRQDGGLKPREISGQEILRRLTDD